MKTVLLSQFYIFLQQNYIFLIESPPLVEYLFGELVMDGAEVMGVILYEKMEAVHHLNLLLVVMLDDLFDFVDLDNHDQSTYYRFYMIMIVTIFIKNKRT